MRRLTHGSRLVLTAAALFPGVLKLAAQEPPATASLGVYSTAQAERGRETYTVFCAGCHAEDLEGTNSGDSGAPPLKHDRFMEGSTVGALVSKVQRSMPLDAPGSLSREAVADVVAFILRENGFPPGAADLPSDPVRLGGIKIERRK